MGGEKCVLGTLLQLNNLPLLTLSDIPLYNLQGTGMQFKPIMTQNLEFMRWEEFFLPVHVHCITLTLSAVQGAGRRLVWVALDNVSSQYCFKYTN